MSTAWLVEKKEPNKPLKPVGIFENLEAIQAWWAIYPSEMNIWI